MEAYFEKSGLDVVEQHNTNNKRRILIGDEETGYYGWSEWEEPEQPIIKEKKIYPNDPCPCGSGKKYKKCCGKKK